MLRSDEMLELGHLVYPREYTFSMQMYERNSVFAQRETQELSVPIRKPAQTKALLAIAFAGEC
jgi:hypothetical protein